MKHPDPIFLTADPVRQLEQLARNRRVEHGPDDKLAESFERGAEILKRRRGGVQLGFPREPGSEG